MSRSVVWFAATEREREREREREKRNRIERNFLVRGGRFFRHQYKAAAGEEIGVVDFAKE
jgi:hypothetical protein